MINMPIFLRTKKDEANWLDAKTSVALQKKKDLQSFDANDWSAVSGLYQGMKVANFVDAIRETMTLMKVCDEPLALDPLIKRLSYIKECLLKGDTSDEAQSDEAQSDEAQSDEATAAESLDPYSISKPKEETAKVKKKREHKSEPTAAELQSIRDKMNYSLEEAVSDMTADPSNNPNKAHKGATIKHVGSNPHANSWVEETKAKWSDPDFLKLSRADQMKTLAAIKAKHEDTGDNTAQILRHHSNSPDQGATRGAYEQEQQRKRAGIITSSYTPDQTHSAAQAMQHAGGQIDEDGRVGGVSTVENPLALQHRIAPELLQQEKEHYLEYIKSTVIPTVVRKFKENPNDPKNQGLEQRINEALTDPKKMEDFADWTARNHDLVHKVMGFDSSEVVTPEHDKKLAALKKSPEYKAANHKDRVKLEQDLQGTQGTRQTEQEARDMMGMKKDPKLLDAVNSLITKHGLKSTLEGSLKSYSLKYSPIDQDKIREDSSDIMNEALHNTIKTFEHGRESATGGESFSFHKMLSSNVKNAILNRLKSSYSEGMTASGDRAKLSNRPISDNSPAKQSPNAIAASTMKISPYSDVTTSQRAQENQEQQEKFVGGGGKVRRFDSKGQVLPEQPAPAATDTMATLDTTAAPAIDPKHGIVNFEDDAPTAQPETSPKIPTPAKQSDPKGFASGGVVPGQASVPGDSTQNDVVDAKLSPGEVVVPRSAAQSPDTAAQFAANQVAPAKSLDAIIAKHPSDIKERLRHIRTARAALLPKEGKE
jgi:hypothetical protein